MIGKILQKMGVVTKDLHSPTLDAKTQATANTAGEKVEWDISMDNYLYGFSIKCAQDTDGTLKDNIQEVKLILDGAKPILDISGDFLKAIALLQGKKNSTGFYTVNIMDEQLESPPLFLPDYTSLKLQVYVKAAGVGVKNVITPSPLTGTQTSFPQLLDTKKSKLCVQTVGTTQQYFAAMGNQDYKHQRGQTVVGYLFAMDDSGVLTNGLFDTITLKLSGKNGDKYIIQSKDIATIREENTQEAGGNALPTGVFYIPFLDGLKTTDYTNIVSTLHIPTAGVDIELTVLERQLFG